MGKKIIGCILCLALAFTYILPIQDVGAEEKVGEKVRIAIVSQCFGKHDEANEYLKKTVEEIFAANKDVEFAIFSIGFKNSKRYAYQFEYDGKKTFKYEDREDLAKAIVAKPKTEGFLQGLIHEGRVWLNEGKDVEKAMIILSGDHKSFSSYYTDKNLEKALFNHEVVREEDFDYSKESVSATAYTGEFAAFLEANYAKKDQIGVYSKLFGKNNEKFVNSLASKDIKHIADNLKGIQPEEPKNKIVRISGKSRIETAVKVSKETYPSGAESVFIANKDKFPDVLTASPLAAQKKAPILFVNKDSVPKETKEEIDRLKAEKVYIVGGTNSVSKKVEDSFKTKKRISGENRYETSIEIAKLVRADGNKKIIEIANGQNFPDALSVSPLAIRDNAPILLVEKNKPTKETKEYIEKNLDEIEIARIAGMYGSVSKEVEKIISNDKKVAITRYGGEDRYETSAKIAELLGSSGTAVYTSGEIFADALVAGGYAGVNTAPLLLVKKDSVPKPIKEISIKLKIRDMKLVGGNSVITDFVKALLVDLK